MSHSDPFQSSLTGTLANQSNEPTGQKTRRGRPVGSKAAIATPFNGLRKNHFAFVRGVLNGLPIKLAWSNYMQTPDDEELPDARAMATLYRSLASQIIEMAQKQSEASKQAQNTAPQTALQRDFSVSPSPQASALKKSLLDAKNGSASKKQLGQVENLRQDTHAMLATLSGLDKVAIRTSEFDGIQESAKDLLSFEEFAEQFQATGAGAMRLPDLQRKYVEHLQKIGEDAQAAAVISSMSRDRKIAAVNEIEGILSGGPRPAASCTIWLAADLAAMLEAQAGVSTLQDLCGFVTSSGGSWFKVIDGLGQARARALELWLESQKHLTPLLPRAGLRSAKTPRKEDMAPSPALSVVKSLGLVPLDNLAPPYDIDGSRGHFRSPHRNTLGASTDLEAIQAWLKLTESAVSRRAYEKEATRFYLWCLLVKRRAMSDLDATDCADYRAFIADIPADWQMDAPYPRGDKAWRPFIGQLSGRSQSYALKVVGIMFNALHQSSYLAANAMREVSKQISQHDSDMDTTRTLHAEARAYVMSGLNALPQSSALNRRKRAIIELAVKTGLRRSEITNAKWGDITQAVVDGNTSKDFEIRIIGKGGKARRVPLVRDLVETLQNHQNDWLELSQMAGKVLPQNRPLIAALEKPVHQITGKSSPNGDQQEGGIRNPIDDQTALAHSNGALSAAGIYATIRGFFREIAQSDLVPVDEKATFLRASVHWLRHTFAHAVIEGTQGNLSVTQELLGHASLQTTGKYLKQDGSARMKAARMASVVTGL